ncbi:MAG: hypothetical protein IJ381_04870 [Clostridia bacterium]|nr:hypothetical protein [Clostridia bacterium]
MKKKNLLLILLLLLMMPSAAGAQELPLLFEAVKDGLSEGMIQGAAMAHDGMTEELTLEMSADSARIEEGKTLRLTLSAGNPRPQETKVVLDLKLPARLRAMQDTTWEATLPPAQMDEERGMLTPSVTTFTRDILLLPGGGSEQTEIETEMSMGTRFYRARLPLALCVADISAAAELTGTEDGRLQPGDTYAYEVEILNKGTAPKDVKVELALPKNVRLGTPVPPGFTLGGGILSGQVHVKAAEDLKETKDSSVKVHIPLSVPADVLDEDEDALCLLTGAMLVDGERVALPRVQVCGARISAQLLADSDSLKAGEATSLRMVIVNSGLAPADVQLSCLLPKGLKLAEQEEEKSEEERDEHTGAVLPEDDGGAEAGEAVPAEAAKAAMADDDRILFFDVHMDAARETDSGIASATKIIEIDVVSDTMQENLKEQLVGTALAWTVDEGETQLSEAVVMRVYQPSFLGIPWKDWNGLFWAGLLLMVTLSLLYAAVRSDEQEQDFCCE